MRRELPSGLAPVLFAIGCGLLALAWALTSTGPLEPSRTERLGDVALWLGCVALATALVWRPAAGSTSLVGLAVALTPSAVELAGDRGDDGLALAAAIALAAGLLRLWAQRSRARAWTWAATSAATATSALVLFAVAQPSVPLGFADAGDAARETWESLWHAFAAWIGREPGFDGGLPVLGVVVWSVALVALVLAADRFAGARERRLLWVAVPLAVVTAAFLFAGDAAGGVAWFSYGPVPPSMGAPLTLLPLCLLALLAGDLLTRAGAALWPRLAAGCFGLLGAVHVLAFVSLHDAAGEGGTPWIAAALLGAVALAAAGAVGATGSAPAAPRARPAKRSDGA